MLNKLRCHGGAKVSCILRHRGIQLILAYSWVRPAILVAGKGIGGMFLFLLFLHFHSCSFFLPCSSLSSLLLFLLSLFSLSLGDDTKWPTRVDESLNPNTINKMPCPLKIFSQSDYMIQVVDLIWIYTVCKGRAYPGSAGQGLRCFSYMKYKSLLTCCRPRWLSWMRRPTGDQEVAGSTPAEVGNILSWRLIMKYFLRSFSPFRWFKKGSCQFLAKECAQYWLTA